MPSWEALAQGARPKRPKPRGGDCGHSAKTWMAAPSISGVGAAPTHGTRTSSDVVPRRPHGRRTVLQFPNDEGDTFRFPAFSPSHLAPPPPSLASYCLPLPMWPSLDVFGHQRAACATVGVLGRRGFALEVSRRKGLPRAGRRVRTNELVRELDLHPGQNHLDARRLEVVEDGLELFSPIGSRHHFGLGTARRRDRLSEGSNSG